MCSLNPILFYLLGSLLAGYLGWRLARRNSTGKLVEQVPPSILPLETSEKKALKDEVSRLKANNAYLEGIIKEKDQAIQTRQSEASTAKLNKTRPNKSKKKLQKQAATIKHLKNEVSILHRKLNNVNDSKDATSVKNKAYKKKIKSLKKKLKKAKKAQVVEQIEVVKGYSEKAIAEALRQVKPTLLSKNKKRIKK